MRNLCLLIISVVIGVLVGNVRAEESSTPGDSTRTVGQHARVFEKVMTKTITCKYLLYLPKEYEQGKKRWPLMLFLHGAGERGDNLELVKKHGPAKLIELGKDYPFIVVSPQCPAGRWWSPDILIDLLDEIIATHRVDRTRVYLTGLSMGGFGTWDLACFHPDRLAAIAPICGGGRPFMARRLKELPVWAFHGAKDNVVPLEQSQEMVKAARAAGGRAKLTVYPNAGHDSWTATYENSKFYEWLLSHRKEPAKK